MLLEAVISAGSPVDIGLLGRDVKTCRLATHFSFFSETELISLLENGCINE